MSFPSRNIIRATANGRRPLNFFNHGQANNQEVVINDRLGETRRFDGCGPGPAPNPRADAHGDFYASEVGYRPGAEVNVGNGRLQLNSLPEN